MPDCCSLPRTQLWSLGGEVSSSLDDYSSLESHRKAQQIYFFLEQPLIKKKKTSKSPKAAEKQLLNS